MAGWPWMNRYPYTLDQMFGRITLLPPLSTAYFNRFTGDAEAEENVTDPYFEISMNPEESPGESGDSDRKSPNTRTDRWATPRDVALPFATPGPPESSTPFAGAFSWPGQEYKRPYLLVNNVRHLHVPERLCKFVHTTPNAKVIQNRAKATTMARAALKAGGPGSDWRETVPIMSRQSSHPSRRDSRQGVPLKGRTLRMPMGPDNAKLVTSLWNGKDASAKVKTRIPQVMPGSCAFKCHS